MVYRVPIILLGYIMAVLMAALVINIAFALPAWRRPAMLFDIQTWRFFVLTVAFVVFFTIVPAIVLIAIAEWRRIRAWGFYAGAGLVVPVLYAGRILQAGHPPGWFLKVHLTSLVLAGLAAGTVYWLIAARCPSALSGGQGQP